jgi:hypothetical protein
MASLQLFTTGPEAIGLSLRRRVGRALVRALVAIGRAVDVDSTAKALKLSPLAVKTTMDSAAFLAAVERLRNIRQGMREVGSDGEAEDGEAEQVSHNSPE